MGRKRVKGERLRARSVFLPSGCDSTGARTMGPAPRFGRHDTKPLRLHCASKQRTGRVAVCQSAQPPLSLFIFNAPPCRATPAARAATAARWCWGWRLLRRWVAAARGAGLRPPWLVVLFFFGGVLCCLLFSSILVLCFVFSRLGFAALWPIARPPCVCAPHTATQCRPPSRRRARPSSSAPAWRAPRRRRHWPPPAPTCA